MDLSMLILLQIIFGLFKIIFKLAIKITRFFGLYWFFLPFAIGLPYELITGGNAFNDPIIGFLCDELLLYIGLALIPVTSIRNIIRLRK